MKKPHQTWQQGDVIGRKLDQLPDGKPVLLGRKKLVLAHGESSHSHVIDSPAAELVRIGERTILTLAESATVKHEEHKPILLEPGLYEIGQVREFDWFAKMERKVVD